MLFCARRDVVEAVEIPESHGFQLLLAALYVLLSVVARDTGQADSHLVEVDMLGQPAEVVKDTTIRYAGVAAIDVGVHVLYIYIIVVDVGGNSLQARKLQIERRFYVNLPFQRTLLAEISNFITTQQRLSSTEDNTSTRSLIVEVIYHHLRENLLHVHLIPYAISPEALRVEAVLAAQRTAVKSNEGGNTLSVGSQTVAANADEIIKWRLNLAKQPLRFKINRTSGSKNVTLIIDNITIHYIGDDAIPGDVNGDGEVTAADVTALYDFLLNNDTTSLANGDQNGDGEITAADVTATYNILLGVVLCTIRD